MTDDEIKKDIEEDIQSVKKDLKDYVAEVFNLKRELDALVKSLTCNHDWVRIGKALYKADKCTKCGYEKDI